MMDRFIVQLWIGITYQQVIYRITAQALEPPGLKGLPQQKHLLANIIRTWLAMRNKKAPTPRPVAMSES
jgi:hypothetical protein